MPFSIAKKLKWPADYHVNKEITTSKDKKKLYSQSKLTNVNGTCGL